MKPYLFSFCVLLVMQHLGILIILRTYRVERLFFTMRLFRHRSVCFFDITPCMEWGSIRYNGSLEHSSQTMKCSALWSRKIVALPLEGISGAYNTCGLTYSDKPAGFSCAPPVQLALLLPLLTNELYLIYVKCNEYSHWLISETKETSALFTDASSSFRESAHTLW